MAYVGNLVSFIKYKINSKFTGYNIYNYSDKPDYSMIELVSLSKIKSILKYLTLRFRISLVFWLVIFDFLSFIFKQIFH